MVKEPTEAAFTCKSCGKRCVANARMGRHILPWMRTLPITETGRCRKCGGDRWTISVFYIEESEPESSMPGMAMSAVFGVRLQEKITSVSQRDFSDVPADIVAIINQVPAQRLTYVAQFARQQERREFMERGAKQCRACSTLFVPTSDKVWASQGYCSKVCLVGVEGAGSLVSFAEPSPPRPASTSTIAVQCAAGHRFDVSVSFQGLRRPCPVCGSKTVVP